MGALTVIEVLDRPGAPRRTYRQSLQPGAMLTVGRGYECDLLIEDPYVAARHLEIRRSEDGSLAINDAGSVNGIRLPGVAEPVRSLAIHGSEDFRELQIGHTRIRVHPLAPQVAPEQPLQPQRRWWPYALLTLWLAFGLIVFESWLDESREFRWSTQIGDALPWVMALLVWSAAWALATRLFSGSLSYARHVLVVCSGVALLVLASMLLDIGAYAFSLSWLSAYEFLPFWLVFGLICAGHLRVVSAAHMPIKVAAVAVLVAIGIAPQMIKLAYPEPGMEAVHVVRKLQPPALQVRSGQSIERFLHHAGNLQEALDSMRDEQVPDDEFADLD